LEVVFTIRHFLNREHPTEHIPGHFKFPDYCLDALAFGRETQVLEACFRGAEEPEAYYNTIGHFVRSPHEAEQMSEAVVVVAEWVKV
jgi:hypothetical protein